MASIRCSAWSRRSPCGKLPGIFVAGRVCDEPRPAAFPSVDGYSMAGVLTSVATVVSLIEERDIVELERRRASTWTDVYADVAVSSLMRFARDEKPRSCGAASYDLFAVITSSSRRYTTT